MSAKLDRKLSLTQWALSDHVLGTGSGQFYPSLQKVHQLYTATAACSQWTDENVPDSAEETNGKAEDKEEDEPDDTVQPATICHGDGSVSSDGVLQLKLHTKKVSQFRM